MLDASRWKVVTVLVLAAFFCFDARVSDTGRVKTDVPRVLDTGPVKTALGIAPIRYILAPDAQLQYHNHRFFNTDADGLHVGWWWDLEKQKAKLQVKEQATPVMLPQSAVDQIVTGKRILFIGDSILRYLYLAVLRSIDESQDLENDFVVESANQFLKKYATADLTATAQSNSPPGNQSHRNIYWQKEWDSWSQFLNGTAAAFDQMCCDCHRTPEKSHIPTHWKTQKENRFYVNEKKGVEASFYFIHGDAGGHGIAHDYQACAASKRASTPIPTIPTTEPIWSGRPVELAEALRAANQTFDAVVVNAGLWYPLWTKNQTYMVAMIDALSSILRKKEDGPAPVGVWLSPSSRCNAPKNGTATAPEPMILDALLNASNKTGVAWKHYDIFSLTKQREMKQLGPVPQVRNVRNVRRQDVLCSQEFVDNVGHLQPYLYKEFSAGLLRLFA
ncbi:hypothetical protein DIPPA_26159 [Diplonema papillatum]|nr:hypothetical protein DIPPA_26159 [Diplonema papillatum]